MKNLILKIKDPVSCLTHMGGAFFAVIGLVLMLLTANAPIEAVAFGIFGGTMFLMYLASTLYHMFDASEQITKALRKFDHVMIYFFIAGTFTPFTMLLIEGSLRWIFLGVIWGIAFAGMVFKLFWLHAPAWLSIALYLGMGWLGLLVLPYAFTNLSAAAGNWIIAGGLSYTIGAVVYGLKRPDPWPGTFGFHEIWHLFVMGGTFAHFWVVYRYLPLS
ncbi:hemolysin III [Cyclonatronum proteinivorum]|uniref:Hemolysin III n=1 Tax=Cyclonatronum proteinivorum TaxID=1457365 RepID=A0A345UGL0_9BACT|nr:hemolysin III family protein [Cyclonatronum proteinivorum]AXI99611.1 hemolysin III [Cyclonatronum proteinivorum]